MSMYSGKRVENNFTSNGYIVEPETHEEKVF